MRIKVYVIQLQLSPRQKRFIRGAVIAGAVVAATGIGVALAGTPIDTSWIQSGQPLAAAQLKGDLDGLQTQVTALQAQVVADGGTPEVIPPGTVVAFAGPVAPPGWLPCDGSAVNRVTYANLFAAIGTTSGYGDGATTFNVPDYRGTFLRGVDADAGRDPDALGRTAASNGGNTGDAVGSVQANQVGPHNHGATGSDSGHSHNPPGAPAGGWNYMMENPVTCTDDSWYFAYGNNTVCGGWAGSTGVGYANLTVSVDSNGTSETRPINAYVNYIVKY